MAIDDDLDEKIQEAVKLMRSRSVVFESGLTDSEIKHTESTFGFRFPPDLRMFLQLEFPVGIASVEHGNFPNWRSGEDAELQKRLDWPFEGIAFDIENNVFWMDEWGPRPDDISAAIEVARKHVDTAPKLIPVYSHRYIPAEPCAAGNPVFSVHQTDIIYYGQNLWDYIEQEFGEYGGTRYADFTLEQYHSVHRRIQFWSDLVS